MVNVYKGYALECGSYRGLRLRLMKFLGVIVTTVCLNGFNVCQHIRLFRWSITVKGSHWRTDSGLLCPARLGGLAIQVLTRTDVLNYNKQVIELALVAIVNPKMSDEKKVKSKVIIIDMQFDLRSGRGTTEAIFHCLYWVFYVVYILYGVFVGYIIQMIILAIWFFFLIFINSRVS